MSIRSQISSRVVSNRALLSGVANLIVRSKGFHLETGESTWDILDQKRSRALRISKKDLQYIQEVTDNFDFLFTSVKSDRVNDRDLVDFSYTHEHTLNGWAHFDVTFPSFAEPTSTTDQYIEFLKLDKGENLIDLGAYAGISSIQFQEEVGDLGRVVALEADPLNAKCTEQNFNKYEALRRYRPSLLNAAAWSSPGVINFAAEGNVGSAVVEISSRDRDTIQVRAMSLSEIVTETSLDTVGAIKADIEGAESEVFRDANFFKDHHPRIIFEAILKGSRGKRYRSAITTLESYGYKCQVIDQYGSKQILIGAK